MKQSSGNNENISYNDTYLLCGYILDLIGDYISIMQSLTMQKVYDMDFYMQMVEEIDKQIVYIKEIQRESKSYRAFEEKGLDNINKLSNEMIYIKLKGIRYQYEQKLNELHRYLEKRRQIL